MTSQAELRKLTAHLLLACSLPMVAGEAWGEELRRAGQLRVAGGEPSLTARWTAAGLDEIQGALRWTTERGVQGHAEIEDWLDALTPSSVPAPASAAALPVLASAVASAAATAASEQSPVPPVPQLPRTRALSSGTPWHLLSVPDEPDNVDPAVLLPTIASEFSLAYTYDACDTIAPWKVYDPADLANSDLTSIDHRVGFWLQATDPHPLAVTGTEPAETAVQLCEGWNLIGYPLAQDRPVLAALSSIAGKFLRVYGFDPTTPKDLWQVYDVGTPDWANTLVTMQRGRGYWVYATEDTTLVMRNVGPPPEVAITSPEDGATATFLTDVVGTAYSDLLERWELAYRVPGETAWTTFATGDTPVVDDVLDVFDPTLLLNGLYTIRLQATDFSGVTSFVTINVAVEGNAKIGHFTLSFIDLDVPVVGVPIQITRIYDSRNQRKGDFGVGWTLELSDVRIEETGPPGLDWEGHRLGAGFPSYCILATAAHVVTIAFPDNEVLKFKPTVVPECQPLVPQQVVDVRYEPLAGTFGSLRPLDHGDRALVVGSFPATPTDSPINPSEPRPIELWDQLTTSIHDPDLYELTTRDGRVLVIDQDRGLVSITDRNQTQLTVSELGISHSSGQGLVFERDAEDRITRIIDPYGNDLTYEYDERGDLIHFENQRGETTDFIYDDNHRLIEIIDPLGVRAVRNDYDADGRLIRTTDASGRAVDLEHDLVDRLELVTDRLGRTALLEYDERGNVVRSVDRLGNTRLRTYDERGNVLTDTNPLGHTTTFTYNGQDDLTRVQDELGSDLSMEYSEQGEVTRIATPEDELYAMAYDSAGNLLTLTDGLGHTYTSELDERGNLIKSIDPEGNEFEYEHDGAGRVTRELGPEGFEATYEYDAGGRLVRYTTFRSTPDGRGAETYRYTYDELGRRSRVETPEGEVETRTYGPTGLLAQKTDRRGETTALEYDIQGRLATINLPGGGSHRLSWDGEDRLVSMTDRRGLTTAMSLDAEGQPTTITFPDGKTLTRTYDGLGNVLTEIDPEGVATTYSYDVLGRPTGVQSTDEGVTYTLDELGNIIRVTALDGETVEVERDLLNRPTRIVLPDDTELRAEYDGLGRIVSRTDAAGQETLFAYDGLGRVSGTTDVLGHTSTYAYDEAGNLASSTDALGRVTRYESDGEGLRTRRVLPDGAAETYTYDAAGNLESWTSPSGAITTYAYDATGRMVDKLHPDGSRVQIDYTPTGRRERVTDPRGDTVYAYDARGLLSQLTDPSGRQLEYAYDGDGLLSSLKATIDGQSLLTQYERDDLGRLIGLVDPQNRTYAYEYDEAGDRVQETYPNGVVASYTYDSRHWVTGIDVTADDGTEIFAETNTRDVKGNIVRAESGDRVRELEYDLLDRLIRETLLDDGTRVSEERFVYDAVGNRVEHTRVAADGSEVTRQLTYDPRDRLLDDGEQTYTWDADGNRTSRDGDSLTEYAWDDEDRLVRVTRSATPEAGVRVFGYDASGDRVRTEHTPDGGSSVGTDYLVDPRPVFSQVIAEIDDDAGLERFYVRGSELMSRIDPQGTVFYHRDALGSIRALSDEAGDMAETFDYSAFGEVRPGGAVPQDYGFAGEAFDPFAGLSYHRARWMDPAVGRFLSKDKFYGSPTDPRTFHSYLYAQANPVNRVDPTGFRDFMTLSVSLFIVATLATIVGSSLVTLKGGARVANAGGKIDVLMVSLRYDGAYRGFVFGGGVDVLWNGDSFWPYVSGQVEGGIHPWSTLFHFGAFRGGGVQHGGGASFGVGFGIDQPNDLMGLGFTAVWPLFVLTLLLRALIARATNTTAALYYQINQIVRTLRTRPGLAGGVSISGQKAAVLSIALRSHDFAILVTGNTPFVRLDHLASQVGSFIAPYLEALGEDLEYLGSLVLALIEAGNEHLRETVHELIDYLLNYNLPLGDCDGWECEGEPPPEGSR